MGFRKNILILVSLVGLCFGYQTEARPYYYPQLRYISGISESLSGVVLPLSDEVGNALMNNPAALARYQGYRSEPLNMNFIMSGDSLSNFSSTLLNSFSLGAISSTMNSNPNLEFGVGFSNMSAFSWNGFAFGILLQEHSTATSDGTNAAYQVVSQMVPTLGYGFGLARNVIRIGYSLQYVNQTAGIANTVSDGSASFLSGLKKGSGLSHNLSINLALPFTYLPTFTIMGRNLGGLHFFSKSLWPRGSNTVGVPSEEPMSVDLSFDFMIRISGTVKSKWYFEYKDFTNRSDIPGAMERLSVGLDFAISPHVSFRGGMTGIANFSGGVSYKGEQSEIALAYYNQESPFSNTESWNSRYALQYKIFLNQKAKKMDGDLQEVGSKR